MLSRVGRGRLLPFPIRNRNIQCAAILRGPDKPQNKLDELFPRVEDFPNHHIGPRRHEAKAMLQTLGYNVTTKFIIIEVIFAFFCPSQNLDELTDMAVPANIRLNRTMDLERPYSEANVIKRIKEIIGKNQIWRTYIGMGYYNTKIPHTIQRNIFENPGWTTQYTPYQPEIAQGRLESLLNYQTMVCDLTGLEVASKTPFFCC